MKRRSQPMIKHGKRRRWSVSLRKGMGDEPREGEILIFMSVVSRLEHERVGEEDFKEEGPGEGEETVR